MIKRIKGKYKKDCIRKRIKGLYKIVKDCNKGL